MPTPAAQVPNTPLGRFYLAIPEAIAKVAAAYAARLGFPAEAFAQEMVAQLQSWNWTFNHVQTLVSENGTEAVLEYLRKGLPTFVIDDPAFDLKLGFRRGDLSDDPEYLLSAGTRNAIAFRQTMTRSDGTVYPTAALSQLAQELAASLDRDNTRGDAWAVSAGLFAEEELRKVFPGGLPSNAWRVLFTSASHLYDRGVRRLEDARRVYRVGELETRYAIQENDGTQLQWDEPITAQIDMDCSGEGCTHLMLGVDAQNRIRFFSYAEVENYLNTVLLIVGAALAVTGIGAAAASIAAEGVTLANAAGLVSGVGSLPNVDLGVVEDIAGGLSSGFAIASKIPGETVLSFDDFETFDLPVDATDFGGFDFDLSLADLDVNLAPGALDDILAGLSEFPIEIAATDVFVDELGNVFDVTGAAVALDPQAYVASIYVDELGNIFDYSNNLLIGAEEAGQIFDEFGSDALDAQLAAILEGKSGTTLVSQQASGARPAGMPAPGASVQVPTWVSDVASIVKAYFSYDLAREQIKRTGRYQPSYPTSPVGQRTPQIPGVPVRQADGSVVVNNGDGTVTTTRPDGTTLRTAATISAGSFSTPLVPGISNTTLLIAGGAAVLAFVLLSRRS